MPSVALLPDTDYQLIIKAGGTSTRGRSVLRDQVIRFRTGRPRMAYLSPANAASDVFVMGLELDRLEPNAPVQRLTSEPFGVHSYAISPDGQRLAYAAKRDADGAMDLWLVNTDGTNRESLLRCDDQVCQYPAWSADGTRIAYEQHNLIKGKLGNSPGPSRIYVLDVDTKNAYPLIEDSQRLGFLPRWSPVGDKLAFYDSTQSAVIVADLATADQIELPSVYGDSGTWSPDGAQLIYSELVPGRRPALQPVAAGRPGAQRHHACAAADHDERHSGRVVAQRRPHCVWAAGAQPSGRHGFANMGGRCDGSNARALTEDAGVNYGAIGWSADGQWLASLRWDLNTPNAVPEVWLVNSTTGERRKLLADAWQPVWFP